MPIRNILWISFEDTSPRFGCYGDPVASTPNVDALAARGRVYTQATCTAGICAPSRCSIITGMYAPAIGCQHMRTSRTSPDYPEMPTPYAGVPPHYVKGFTEYLRAAGWFCTNNGKTDYQFGNPASLWDLNRAAPEDELESVHWRRRPDPQQPFFAVFNLALTHESGQFLQGERAPAVTDRDAVQVPPYLVDGPDTREAIARQYDHIAHNDALVGTLLAQLKEDGLAEETAVFIWSDHGEGLPRCKSWCYDGGLRIPLIAHVPGETRPGERRDESVSLIDLGPTVLSVLERPIPVHMQGQAFLGSQAQAPRTYAFAHRDRIGEAYDHVRCVRDRRFTYLRNYDPLLNRQPHQAYRHQHPALHELYAGERSGTLRPEQRWMFEPVRAPEELYDRQADPHELINLAADSTFRTELVRLRSACDDWVHAIGDLGRIDEAEMVRRWYPDGEPPITAAPQLTPVSGEHDGRHVADPEDELAAPGPVRLILQSATQGASLEYRLDDGPWLLGNMPLTIGEQGRYRLRARAQRYGFEQSVVRTWRIVVS